MTAPAQYPVSFVLATHGLVLEASAHRGHAFVVCPIVRRIPAPDAASAEMVAIESATGSTFTFQVRGRGRGGKEYGHIVQAAKDWRGIYGPAQEFRVVPFIPGVRHAR